MTSRSSILKLSSWNCSVLVSYISNNVDLGRLCIWRLCIWSRPNLKWLLHPQIFKWLSVSITYFTLCPQGRPQVRPRPSPQYHLSYFLPVCQKSLYISPDVCTANDSPIKSIGKPSAAWGSEAIPRRFGVVADWDRLYRPWGAPRQGPEGP